MATRAFLFPGQGAQKVGMCKDIYDAVPAAKQVFERAAEAAGFDLIKATFEGPDDVLNDTAVCQPAILAASIAALEAYKATKGADAAVAQMTAGLSLGEYTALVYAGAIKFEDAVRLVRRRGIYMKEAGQINPGAMLSLLGPSREVAAEIVNAAKASGTIVAANFNSPGQIVLSGTVEAITAAEQIAKDKGCRRAIRLVVSGAFHSPLMEPAAEKLRAELARTEIADPQVPLVSNVTAKFVKTAAEVRELLSKQLTSSVLWEDSMVFMAQNGMQEAVEFGPGRVLSGLLAKTVKDIPATGVGSMADLA